MTIATAAATDPAAEATADAATLIASRLERVVERLDLAATELASVVPDGWRGPAAAGFAVARSAAVERLTGASRAAHEAVELSRRAAVLARGEVV